MSVWIGNTDFACILRTKKTCNPWWVYNIFVQEKVIKWCSRNKELHQV